MSDLFPIIQTERLSLVEITQEHLVDLFTLFGDTRVTQFYNVTALQNVTDAQKFIDWFQNRFKEKAGIRWGIAFKEHHSIIGTIGFNNFTKNHRANIGYDLQFAYWNKGYITEALKAIIPFGFTQLEINRIEAEVMQGNLASEKVLTKLGFKNECILREWMRWENQHYDMSMFSLLRKDYATRTEIQ